jgi:hypothetical protein
MTLLWRRSLGQILIELDFNFRLVLTQKNEHLRRGEFMFTAGRVARKTNSLVDDKSESTARGARCPEPFLR